MQPHPMVLLGCGEELVSDGALPKEVSVPRGACGPNPENLTPGESSAFGLGVAPGLPAPLE